MILGIIIVAFPKEVLETASSVWVGVRKYCKISYNLQLCRKSSKVKITILQIVKHYQGVRKTQGF